MTVLKNYVEWPNGTVTLFDGTLGYVGVIEAYSLKGAKQEAKNRKGWL